MTNTQFIRPFTFTLVTEDGDQIIDLDDLPTSELEDIRNDAGAHSDFDSVVMINRILLERGAEGIFGAEMIAELDALPEGAKIGRDRDVPGLIWFLDSEGPEAGPWPLGPDIDYDKEDEDGFDEAQDIASDLLDEIGRLGYPIGR